MLRFFKKRWKLVVFLLITLVILFFVLRPRFLPKLGYDPKTSSLVKQGDLKEELVISGELDANEKATLRFPTSGRLTWVGVKEGDYVKKYQGIASLDKRELEKNLKKKLLAYMNERWDFEQGHDDKLVFGRDINRMGELTVEERRILEKSQFDLDTTVLDVEIADLAVQFSYLWTPIDGLVTRIDVPHPGTNITAATAEFDIVNPDSVFFKASADETEVTKVKEGMSGSLLLDAFPNEELRGSISNISFIPDSSGTGVVYTVKFNFGNLNPGYKYRMRMVGDLTFPINSREGVFYLPSRFVLSESGNKFVYVKREEKVVKTKVKTGMETDDDIEIINGLKKGDRVYLPQ